MQTLVEARHGERILVSTDASVFVHPQSFQYDRDDAYLHGKFAAELRERIGADQTQQVLEANVTLPLRGGEQILPQQFGDVHDTQTPLSPRA